MKVFQLINNPYKELNPYVSSLMDSISAEHKDVVWGYGIDNFWSDSIYDYDIIHIHWPDQILRSDLCKKESIGERLIELKSKGVKIVVTCHNFEPHYCNDNDKIEAYKSVYSHADCFIHLGDYSKRIMEVKYPQANHIVIYHHTYDKLYSTKNRTESLRHVSDACILSKVYSRMDHWWRCRSSITACMVGYSRYWPANVSVLRRRHKTHLTDSWQ